LQLVQSMPRHTCAAPVRSCTLARCPCRCRFALARLSHRDVSARRVGAAAGAAISHMHNLREWKERSNLSCLSLSVLLLFRVSLWTDSATWILSCPTVATAARLPRLSVWLIPAMAYGHREGVVSGGSTCFDPDPSEPSASLIRPPPITHLFAVPTVVGWIIVYHGRISVE
jgi:hypothetical protein